MYYNIAESGKRIRTLREAAGLTRQSFSEQIGVSVEALRKIENGNNGGKIDTLVLIADELHVSLDYLVCGKSKQTEQEDVFSGLKENEILFLRKMAESMKANLIYLQEQVE